MSGDRLRAEVRLTTAGRDALNVAAIKWRAFGLDPLHIAVERIIAEHVAGAQGLVRQEREHCDQANRRADRWRERCDEARKNVANLEAERDALAAKVARVEALAEEWSNHPYPQTGDAGWNQGYDMRCETDAEDLRAALEDRP